MRVKGRNGVSQNTMRNSEVLLIQLPKDAPDGLMWWMAQYFRFEVTTALSSQKVQRRDLELFLRYMRSEEKTDARVAWTPRLSGDFQTYLQRMLKDGGGRVWSDKTIVRMMAHLKTFAKWVHKLRPFPLGNPMTKIRMPGIGTGLEIERALTPAERRKVLDAADLLLVVGGLSKDRKRYKHVERPRRKGYRPHRNRAVVYALMETGMRRAAVTKLNLDDIDFRRKLITVEEKGGYTHSYQISQDGLRAIQDYILKERAEDAVHWQSPALFLPTATTRRSSGRLAVLAVNDIWNAVYRVAAVSGKTPHSARHAMGKHIIEKTGNIAAVQKQLGHKQAAYSMQYARITAEELGRVLDER
ncbi:MAG: site-specific integrase [Deltaproteobacteria bacterium]|nr:site-specific integrase [Deltaproteobacteria bacterium]